MKDEYDEAIEYLAEHPDEIENAWYNPSGHAAGCLFKMMTPDGKNGHRDDGQECGCATMIKPLINGSPSKYVAWTDELTNSILADDRIPNYVANITTESLPAFAEIQRLADRTIRQ